MDKEKVGGTFVSALVKMKKQRRFMATLFFVK